MPSKSPDAALQEIQENIKLARQFVTGLSILPIIICVANY